MTANVTLERVKKLIQANRLVEASATCRRLLDQGPNPEAIYLLAVITCELGLLGEAQTLFEKAIRDLEPRSDVFYNFGSLLQRMGKLDAAMTRWTEAVALDPRHTDALFNLARGHSEKRMWAEALPFCERAAALAPRNPAVLLSLGNINFRLGRLAHAKYCFNQAITVDPNYLQAWINLGLAELRDGDPRAAIAALQKAVMADSESILAHFNLGLALLADGRMRQGWAELEWRRRAHTLPFPAAGRQPWRGEDVAGERILLYGEQGQGDTIHYLRYARTVAERGARIAVSCHAGLVGIARGAAGVEDAVAFGEPPPAFDVYAPLMSLPHLLGLPEIEDAPVPPYLTPPVATALPGDAGALKVGLVWAGNPDHDDDGNRSMSLADFKPLLTVAGARLFGLQVGDARRQIDNPDLGGAVADLGGGFRDFADTAAALQALDLLISVDTAAAHLAGALGRRCWLLLPGVPDWRWRRDGDETPWYPTLRLFRRGRTEAWAPVIARLAGALADLAQGGILPAAAAVDGKSGDPSPQKSNPPPP